MFSYSFYMIDKEKKQQELLLRKKRFEKQQNEKEMGDKCQLLVTYLLITVYKSSVSLTFFFVFSACFCALPANSSNFSLA